MHFDSSRQTREQESTRNSQCSHVSSIRISNAARPTESMESAQQPSLFGGMFFLKLAGHVTKLSKTSNWLITFVLLSANNFIGWRVYSCLVNSFGRICF